MDRCAVTSVLSIVLLGAGCPSASTEAGTGRRAPPPDASLSVTFSDLPGEEFHGNGNVLVQPLVVVDDPSRTGRSISMQVMAWGGADLEHVVGFGGNFITDADLTALADGRRVVLPPSTQASAGYPPPDPEVTGSFAGRDIIAMSLVLSAGLAQLTADLGGMTRSLPPALPEGPDETTATAVVRGQLPIACAMRNETDNIIGDPRWASDFCARARTDMHLDAWIGASM